MDDGRGFSLSHQRVVLDIDFAGVITASAHLTIHPTSPALRTLYLHASPLLQISNVTLSSPTQTDSLLPTPVSFALTQPFQPLPSREPPIDIRSHTEIKRKVWAATNERDEGELAISVSGGWVRLLEGEMALAPIEVQIDYRLVLGGDVVEGIVFDGETVHLSPTTYDAARIWTPCVDSLWERCTWEMEFIVPSTMDNVPVMVVSSGELIEQTTHPHSPSKTIFYYMQTTPTSVQHITFAAGPFETHVIAEYPKPILGFCLPSDIDLLVGSTAFLPKAMSFYSTEYGSYPFTEFKVVFVPNPRVTSSTAASVAIFSTDLLHPSTVIDQVVPTRQALSLALIQQWVGISIIQRTLADTWLIHGLALYLNSQFLRHLLGNNEYRFRLKKDIERCVRLDQGDQWPICVPGALDPPNTSFINIKAPLVLHILDRYLAKTGTSLGLSRVIPRIFLAALSDELPGNTLSTQFFFRTCRKVSGIDLQSFQDLWVYGSGCPHFRLHTNFIRKKFTVELYMTQIVRATEKRAVPFFEGGLTVRIHEADGAPFEHVVDIKTPQKMYNLPFNTKYKRTRRSGHIAARFRKLQEELAAEEDPEEAQPKTTEVFAYPPWEDEEERQRWRVAEWTEEQTEAMLGEGGGYEWIRIDPDCEWLASFEFAEKPWCWISQLQSDRDVVAQLESVQNMALNASPVVASELARTILVENYFYRVRMEAAKALVNYCSPESEYIGLFYLLKVFQTLFCTDKSEPLEADFDVVKNDFSDFPKYFLKKTIVTALANLRDPTNRTSWRSVRKFLIKLFHTNDNSVNPYSDAYYLATLISASGNAFSASDRSDEVDIALTKDAVEAVQKLVTMDRLVPSFHNIITQAGLKTHLKLIMAGQQTNDARQFLGYTREGNFEPLRLVAFDCLMISRPPGRSPAVTNYLADVVRNDASLVVRRHVARGLSEAVLASLALGDVPGALAPGLVDVTDDSEKARSERSEAHNSAIVKALRKEFGKKMDLRSSVQKELLDSFTGTDHELRLALIKLAEIMVSSVPEPMPGNLITLSTPAVETPVVSTPTPKIRFNLGAKEEGYGFPEPAAPAVAVPASAPLKLVLGNQGKKKAVPKSQSRGLPEADWVVINKTLKKLVNHSTSYLFRQPVDPVRDEAPDYLSVVKQPMDLSTAKARLDNGMYATRQDFAADIKLIVHNCKLYNAPGSPVYKVAEDFEKYFNNLWTRTEQVLNNPAPSKISSPSIEQPAAPPVPKAPQPLKIKVSKPAKSVTIDPTPTQLIEPMGPPPVPHRRPSDTSSSFASPKRPDLAAPPPPPPTKKRKGPSKSTLDLDDMLGAEVDAMITSRSNSSSRVDDEFESLLEPRMKKVKLPSVKPAQDRDKEREKETEREKEEEKERASEREKEKEKENAQRANEKERERERENEREREKVKKEEESRPKPEPTPPPAKLRSSPVVPPAALPPGPQVDNITPPPLPGTAFPNYVQPRPPADLPPTVSNSMPFKLKRARPLLSILTKDPNAIFFLRPVDPVLDGVPTYLEEIKEPMDLGTITKKIDAKKYKTMGKLAYDIELVFSNCRKFNNPGDSVTLTADALEAVYWREWPKVVSSKMTPGERKDMSTLLNRLIKDNVSLFFREPVDPEALGIPHYFNIIPREDARDLSLIKRNLDKGVYSTAKAVDEDIELMLENARVFNEEGPVVDAADALRKWWESHRAKME